MRQVARRRDTWRVAVWRAGAHANCVSGGGPPPPLTPNRRGTVALNLPRDARFFPLVLFVEWPSSWEGLWGFVLDDQREIPKFTDLYNEIVVYCL